jgi:hypothetical protein
MAAGEMSEAQFTGFLKSALEQLANHSVDGCLQRFNSEPGDALKLSHPRLG